MYGDGRLMIGRRARPFGAAELWEAASQGAASCVLGVAALTAILACAAACGPAAGGRSEEIPVDAASLPPEADFTAGIDRSRGFRDCFRPITEPELVPAARAIRMQPGERVLGVDLGSVRIAYPVNTLNHFEIVEHTAAGQELLVCW
jgi:hypothetical protein